MAIGGLLFENSAGNAISNSLKNNNKIMKVLEEALDAIAKGRM